MAFDWNDRNIGHLSEMWAKGVSARQIALAIGAPSRNSVVGKAHRLGLTGRPSPIKRDGPKKPKPERPSNTIRVHVSASGVRKTMPNQQPAVPKQVPAEPELNLLTLPKHRSVPVIEGRPTRFNELKRGQCSWISAPTVRFRADEAICCGGPVDGPDSPWCSAHRKLAKGTGTQAEQKATEGVAA